MAHSVSARKRVRQNLRRRALNRWRLRAMRAAIKDLHEQLLHGTNEEITTSFRAAGAVIDRAAQNRVIHRNQAARRKSRLNARVKAKITG
ncbi:MAG: 30S ribosomal protein S20 [Planctomycetota bacterium]